MKKLILLFALIMASTSVFAQIVLDADFYGSLGDFLMKNGYEENALKSYEKGLSIEPENKEILNNIGYCYQDKDPKLAEEYFLMALEVDSTYENARNNLALLYNKLSDYSKAIEQLSILLKTYPENKQYNYDLAVNYANRFFYETNTYEDLDDAIKYFKLTSQIDESFMFSMQNIKVLEEIRGG